MTDDETRGTTNTGSSADVTITRGTVAAGNIGGSGNTVNVDTIGIGGSGADELDELRERIADLVARLGEHEGGDALLARERAEVLHAELSTDEPDGPRVHTMWNRLQDMLEVVKVGVDVGRLAESVSRLF